MLPYRDYLIPRIRKAAVLVMFDIVESIAAHSAQAPANDSVRRDTFGTLDYVQNLNVQSSCVEKQLKSEFYQILIEIAYWAMEKFALEPDQECRCFQRFILQMTADLIGKEN